MSEFIGKFEGGKVVLFDGDLDKRAVVLSLQSFGIVASVVAERVYYHFDEIKVVSLRKGLKKFARVSDFTSCLLFFKNSVFSSFMAKMFGVYNEISRSFEDEVLKEIYNRAIYFDAIFKKKGMPEKKDAESVKLNLKEIHVVDIEISAVGIVWFVVLKRKKEE